MKLTAGDIILVPFPYSDLSGAKTRPALIIHENEEEQDIIILGLTSKPKGKSKILITNQELRRGVLPIASYIRYNKVTNLHKALVKKQVAHLAPHILKEVIEKFKKQF